ncbi:hypothetical protein GCM10023115_24050 [Pontixanthobacter gangjinensis]|uniref:Uncharacterized protein n=1 Tax=Pontixanthobacter gangjinensis TaxID=1028742 RepID=A0A6I4SQJ3_9SPHN|nr:hypothetical protein [Pontixanthobacter gangjinensis]MXO57648.1 hypothetical protein [Pontixanthobacter gangjinensis]
MMLYLIENYELASYPERHNLPAYKFNSLFGPKFALKFIAESLGSPLSIEILDFDDGSVSTISDPMAIDGSGDCLYIIYKDPADWIYLYSSDLDYGVLYSNINLEKVVSPREMLRASENFVKSNERRLTLQPEYYDASVLRSWARIMGVNGGD